MFIYTHLLIEVVNPFLHEHRINIVSVGELNDSNWQFSGKRTGEFRSRLVAISKDKDPFKVRQQSCVVFLPTVRPWYSNTRNPNASRQSKGIQLTFTDSNKIICSLHI